MDYEEEIKSLKEQLNFSETIKDTDYKNIVIAGMGGSGIAGNILRELYTEKPLVVVQDYKIPEFVGRDTLFIGSSYSGTTEETLAAVALAKKRGAHIVTISSGGELSKYGDENVHIPRAGLQPRAAIGYLLVPLLLSFKVSTKSELRKAQKLVGMLDKDNSECKMHAKKIFKGSKIPVVYGVDPFKNIAYRWKTQFSENAKVIAYSNSFPELNHNDTMALSKTYRKSLFYLFVFTSEDKRMTKRIELTSHVTNTPFHMIKPKGASVTEKLFYLIHYGDYVSYHLGKLRGVDTRDVSLVEEIKKGLKTSK
jgi:glucose/mannose-6-phosphate isomerase